MLKKLLGVGLILFAIGKVVYDVYLVKGHTGDVVGYFNVMIQTSNVTELGMIGGGFILGMLLLAVANKEDTEHLSHR